MRKLAFETRNGKMLDDPVVYYKDNYYRDRQELIDYLLDMDEVDFEKLSYLSTTVNWGKPIFLADCLPRPKDLKDRLEEDSSLNGADILENSFYYLTYLLDEDWDEEVKGIDVFTSCCRVIEAIWLLTGIFLYPLARLSLKIVGAINNHLYVWDSLTGKDAFLSLDELVQLRKKY